MSHPRGVDDPARALLAATLAAGLAACATPPPPAPTRFFEAPIGARAFGVEFGKDREDVSRGIRSSTGQAPRRDPGDDDALVASRCPAAPVDGPCRLLFGPAGLYAAEIRVPLRAPGDLPALEASLVEGLGAPTSTAPGAAPAPAGDATPPIARLVASWESPDWTLTLARIEETPGAAVALVRAEYDRAAPPVVAGIPLGRTREAVEGLLARRGAIRVQREEETTTYLQCPDGAAEAVSCVLEWREGRAASVTEVFSGYEDDKRALEDWRHRTEVLEREIGRGPEVECPLGGPERVSGECSATWTADRLLVVVGAHRGAGGRHRGAISVYTVWAYPPLLPAQAPPAPRD